MDFFLVFFFSSFFRRIFFSSVSFIFISLIFCLILASIAFDFVVAFGVPDRLTISPFLVGVALGETDFFDLGVLLEELDFFDLGVLLDELDFFDLEVTDLGDLEVLSRELEASESLLLDLGFGSSWYDF